MEAFIRNTGAGKVTLKVELFGKSNMPTLPNHIKAATISDPVAPTAALRIIHADE